ncbi:MAG: methyltransferase type 12 [Anaerolineaceae bacterium]|nr:methyltransferase type 12 [Anaerolineaceae bacterium]
MTHDEMVALIRNGVGPAGGTWADFGAGAGNFTRALHELVGPQAMIYAVDRDAYALRQQRDVITIQADFTAPLELPPLDGVLMANALHWVRDQQSVLIRIASCLRPDGRLLLVEYAVEQPRSYIPFPVPLTRFEALARQSGFASVQPIGTRISPSSGTGMYAAVAFKAMT